MAESTAVVLAKEVKIIPLLSVENEAESDAMEDCWVETTPERDPDTEATWLSLATIAVEI